MNEVAGFLYNLFCLIIGKGKSAEHIVVHRWICGVSALAGMEDIARDMLAIGTKTVLCNKNTEMRRRIVAGLRYSFEKP